MSSNSVSNPLLDTSNNSTDGSNMSPSDSEQQHVKRNKSLLTLILWFIIITVVAWIVLWSWKPEIVQKTDSQGQPTGEPDGAKVLIGSIVIGLLLIIVIYLLWYCCV